MIAREQLVAYYFDQKLSVQEIATTLGCSVNQVIYWMDKHQLKRRTISEAIYQKHNPDGDPFSIRTINSIADAELLGMGLGLYWGEGNKANKYSIRLGNTDPELIKTFIRFLTDLFGIDKHKLRFGLQLFTDTNPDEALIFWTRALGVKDSQFYKITVTISGSIGTYRHKNTNGVLTVYYHNKKLRDILVGMLPR